MYNQSTMLWGTAKSQVAEVAGAQGKLSQLNKAAESLQLALKYWNSKRSWNYLLTTAPVVTVIAPFTVESCTLLDGSPIISNASVFADVQQYDVVSGTGLAPETIVLTADPTSTTDLTLNYNASSPTSPQTLTFSRRDYLLPTTPGQEVNRMYSVRLIGSNPRRLLPFELRERDTLESDQTIPDVPLYYSLYTVSGEGRIRLIPTPSTSDFLLLKYYRRMRVPAITDDSATLDIPEDYDQFVVALAKAFFTADKGSEVNKNSFWWRFGIAGLEGAISDDNVQPDEDIRFQPSTTPLPFPAVDTIIGSLLVDEF